LSALPVRSTARRPRAGGVVPAVAVGGVELAGAFGEFVPAELVRRAMVCDEMESAWDGAAHDAGIDVQQRLLDNRVGWRRRRGS
jgi:hypothetical protein